MIVTHVLSADLSFSQAMQQIFLASGRSMFPRKKDGIDSYLWDENTSSDVAVPNAHPLLTTEEVYALGELCTEFVWCPHLLNRLTIFLQKLPNQHRFYSATYLQPHIIASIMCWHITTKSCRN